MNRERGGLTPWQIAVISMLGAATSGLLLLLIGALVESSREAQAEREDLRRALREHILSPNAHLETRPRYPEAWRER